MSGNDLRLLTLDDSGVHGLSALMRIDLGGQTQCHCERKIKKAFMDLGQDPEAQKGWEIEGQ
jgi:hypothetical protein